MTDQWSETDGKDTYVLLKGDGKWGFSLGSGKNEWK